MQKYSLDEKIFYKEIDNHIFILRKGEKYFLELNDTASLIFKSILKGKNTSKIVDILTKEYKVDVDEAKKDIKDFLEEYVHLGILIQK